MEQVVQLINMHASGLIRNSDVKNIPYFLTCSKKHKSAIYDTTPPS